MKRLAHVAFTTPIPIPGSHVRQADFSAVDGWTLEDDDGCITLEKGTTRFYTYVSASCVEGTSPGSSVVEQSPDKRPGEGSIPSPVAINDTLDLRAQMAQSNADAAKVNERAMLSRRGKR